MKIVVDLTPTESADPWMIVDSLFDFLCSMGDDKEARARLDAAVVSFDGAEPTS